MSFKLHLCVFFFWKKMMRFFFLKKMGEMHFCYKKRVYLFCANNYYFLKEDKKEWLHILTHKPIIIIGFDNVNKNFNFTKKKNFFSWNQLSIWLWRNYNQSRKGLLLLLLRFFVCCFFCQILYIGKIFC